MSDDPTTSHPGTPEPRPAAPVTPGGAPSPAAAPAWTAATLPPVEPVQPVAPAKPKSGSSGRWLNVLLGIALVFAVGGVAFAIGRTTAPASAATNGRGTLNGGFVGGGTGPNGSFAPNGGGFLGGRGAGGLSISGTVTSVDGDKLTITTDNGQTVTLTTGDSTTYHTQAPASASDVTSGDKVSVKVDLAGRVNGGGNGNGSNGTGNGGNGASGLSGTASDVTIIP